MLNIQEKQLLSDLMNIIRTIDVPMIVVGAGARLLVFDQKFGKGRGTKDWDIAISIDSWKSYQELREYLSTGDYPLFKSTKNSHKFIHIATKIEVDIVPFGKIGEPEQQIIWPDTGNSMNVLGFVEALSYSKIAKIDDLEIPVIDVPAFIVLKLFAWGDRGERTDKDLDDIEFILLKYQDDDRVYTELVEELANGTVEFMDATIYLLGQDIHQILYEKTRIELNLLLDRLIQSLDINSPKSLGYMLEILQEGINSLS